MVPSARCSQPVPKSPIPALNRTQVELASASVVLSVALSVGCYAASFRSGCMLARGGDSGNAVYDFFIGRPGLTLTPHPSPLTPNPFASALHL